MNILFTGKGGKSGSWKIRAEQLGAAMGATVVANASDVRAYDLTVVVKRTPDQVMAAVRKRPWVWDIVDAYPQPMAYRWEPGEAIRWVRSKITALKPTAVIWPNKRMREDCDTGIPGLVLPHHFRPKMALNPIRPEIVSVGYEGSPRYLGKWSGIVEAECRKRGLKFVMNPVNLADVDVVVALRDGGGYVCKHWKSGVKLANAHGSGTPFIGSRECGYLENATGAEYWAHSPQELSVALDWLKSETAREEISDRFRQAAYPVERAAKDLRAFLTQL